MKHSRFDVHDTRTRDWSEDVAAELRVFILPECIINPAPATELPQPEIALASVLVPKLVEMAIGSAAKLLKDAGADKTILSSGSAVTNLFAAGADQSLDVNGDVGCLLAVHGDFDSDEAEPDDGDEVLQSLRQRGLISSRTMVNIVFEAEVRPSADRTAFFLDTRHFSVRNLIEDDDDDERDFAVTVALTTPLTGVSGETVAIGTIDFGTLAPPSDVVPQGRPADGHPQFRSNLMPWAQLSPVAKHAYDTDVSNGSAAGRRYMPVTFTVTVSQTEKGHPFLIRLGELLDGAKHNAAAAIGKQ